MRLPGHGKNTASSVIVFPQIIFLSIEKHILEVWLVSSSGIVKEVGFGSIFFNKLL